MEFGRAGHESRVALSLAAGPVASVFSAWPRLRDEAALAGIGALVYGGAVMALFGPQWLASWLQRARPTAVK